MGFHVQAYNDNQGNIIEVGDPIWYVVNDTIVPGRVLSIWAVEPKFGAPRARLRVRSENESEKGWPRYGEESNVHNSRLTVKREVG